MDTDDETTVSTELNGQITNKENKVIYLLYQKKDILDMNIEYCRSQLEKFENQLELLEEIIEELEEGEIEDETE